MAEEDRGSFEYTPLGESGSIKLSVSIVRRVLNPRTKSGQEPREEDVLQFLALCKARCLNPFTGDAYLIGYDGEKGPTWSLITAIQALYKRAELSPRFDGIESGVIVVANSGELQERAGDLRLPGETLIGAWAKVWKKGLRVPFYEAINLETYRRKTRVWQEAEAMQLVKCAEAGALRRAFPTDLGGMYVREEGGLIERTSEAAKPHDISFSRVKDLGKLLPGPHSGREDDEPRTSSAQPKARQAAASKAKTASKSTVRAPVRPAPKAEEAGVRPEELKSAPRVSASLAEFRSRILRCKTAREVVEINSQLGNLTPQEASQAAAVTDWMIDYLTGKEFEKIRRAVPSSEDEHESESEAEAEPESEANYDSEDSAGRQLFGS